MRNNHRRSIHDCESQILIFKFGDNPYRNTVRDRKLKRGFYSIDPAWRQQPDIHVSRLSSSKRLLKFENTRIGGGRLKTVNAKQECAFCPGGRIDLLVDVARREPWHGEYVREKYQWKSDNHCRDDGTRDPSRQA